MHKNPYVYVEKSVKIVAVIDIMPKKKTKHQEIMDRLGVIEKKLIEQSYFGWYVLGIGLMISGASLLPRYLFPGLAITILGCCIWTGALILTQKLKKQ